MEKKAADIATNPPQKILFKHDDGLELAVDNLQIK